MTFSPASFFRPAVLAFTLGLVFACDSGGDDMADTTGNGDGGTGTDGGETGGNSGTGTGTESGGGDSDCPLGSFDCPCDNGMCAEGLTCNLDGLCSLGGDTGNPTTTTGDPTTTTTSAGDTTATTGGGSSGPYDPEGCEEPNEVLSVEMLDGEFCAAPCTEDADCPDGPSGTTSACAISTNGVEPEYCALICKPGDGDCPVGSECEEIPQQPGFGLCTY